MPSRYLSLVAGHECQRLAKPGKSSPEHSRAGQRPRLPRCQIGRWQLIAQHAGVWHRRTLPLDGSGEISIEAGADTAKKGGRPGAAVPGPLRFAARALRATEGQARLLPPLVLYLLSSRKRRKFRQSAALKDPPISAPNRSPFLGPRYADSRGDASETLEVMGMAPVLCRARQHITAASVRAFQCTLCRCVGPRSGFHRQGCRFWPVRGFVASCCQDWADVQDSILAIVQVLCGRGVALQESADELTPKDW